MARALADHAAEHGHDMAQVAVPYRVRIAVHDIGAQILHKTICLSMPEDTMTIVPIEGLWETHLTVSNLDRSIAFYRDVHGLPLAQTCHSGTSRPSGSASHAGPCSGCGAPATGRWDCVCTSRFR
jgi:hypothetical protein